jgi:hypothetical protein
MEINNIQIIIEPNSDSAKIIDHGHSAEIYLDKKVVDLLDRKGILQKDTDNHYSVPNYYLIVSPPEWEITMNAPVTRVDAPVIASILDDEKGKTKSENHRIICCLDEAEDLIAEKVS